MSKIEPLWNTTTRMKLSEIVPLDTPIRVQIDPCSRCNFKCVYCPHSLSKQAWDAGNYGRMEDMSMETFCKIAEQLQQFPQQVRRLNLCGVGEPLMNKNLPEMIRLVKESGAAKRVVVLSNGSLLTPALSDALIDAGLDDLRISLQGLSGKKYKEICGVEIDYEQYYDNLRYYYEHKKDQHLFVKVIDVALEDGEQEKFYQMFDGISDRMYVEKCHYVEGVSFTKGLQNDTVDRNGFVHTPRTVCSLPFFTMMVHTNGDVLPCCDGKPIILGNVHSQTLQEIFTGEKLRKFQKMQLRGQRCNNAACRECFGPNDDVQSSDALDGAAAEILARLEK